MMNPSDSDNDDASDDILANSQDNRQTNRRSTRTDIAILRAQQGDIMALMCTKRIYAQSTIRKHGWAGAIYKGNRL